MKKILSLLVIPIFCSQFTLHAGASIDTDWGWDEAAVDEKEHLQALVSKPKEQVHVTPPSQTEAKKTEEKLLARVKRLGKKAWHDHKWKILAGGGLLSAATLIVLMRRKSRKQVEEEPWTKDPEYKLIAALASSEEREITKKLYDDLRSYYKIRLEASKKKSSPEDQERFDQESVKLNALFSKYLKLYSVSSDDSSDSPLKDYYLATNRLSDSEFQATLTEKQKDALKRIVLLLNQARIKTYGIKKIVVPSVSTSFSDLRDWVDVVGKKVRNMFTKQHDEVEFIDAFGKTPEQVNEMLGISKEALEYDYDPQSIKELIVSTYVGFLLSQVSGRRQDRFLRRGREKEFPLIWQKALEHELLPSQTFEAIANLIEAQVGLSRPWRARGEYRPTQQERDALTNAFQQLRQDPFYEHIMRTLISMLNLTYSRDVIIIIGDYYDYSGLLRSLIQTHNPELLEFPRIEIPIMRGIPY